MTFTVCACTQHELLGFTSQYGGKQDTTGPVLANRMENEWNRVKLYNTLSIFILFALKPICLRMISSYNLYCDSILRSCVGFDDIWEPIIWFYNGFKWLWQNGWLQSIHKTSFYFVNTAMFVLPIAWLFLFGRTDQWQRRCTLAGHSLEDIRRFLWALVDHD